MRVFWSEARVAWLGGSVSRRAWFLLWPMSLPLKHFLFRLGHNGHCNGVRIRQRFMCVCISDGVSVLNRGSGSIYVATSSMWEMILAASRSGMVVGGGFF